MSTGRPPHKVEYDSALVIRICEGLRPEFAQGTPECYVQLANQCMDAIPSNRPTASYIYDELFRWYKIVDGNAAKDKNELTILKAFQSADAIIPTLLVELPNCPKDKLTTNTEANINSSVSSSKINNNVSTSELFAIDFDKNEEDPETNLIYGTLD
ncbi:hypothetical protein C2G38_2042771 [Gigaspora rosea]|uniref:Serine-threonine/tyrosine-protein kinase catalytic domain-containing protein n=1 Tax=Gigaspora rosea TaxID=44941 RepID=A0A397UUY9_9GLOM|nr:hypothetical protein C2G38_2042771 [Gigaspora rosea]